MVTALPVLPLHTLVCPLSPPCPRLEHHSTRIKYWLRFWFIVIAGGSRTAREREETGPIGEGRSDRAFRGWRVKEGEWIGVRETGRISEGGWGRRGWERVALEAERRKAIPVLAFPRWQMHLPKRCGRFWLVLRRHAARRYYGAFLFSDCYRSSLTEFLRDAIARNNPAIYCAIPLPVNER